MHWGGAGGGRSAIVLNGDDIVTAGGGGGGATYNSCQQGGSATSAVNCIIKTTGYQGGNYDNITTSRLGTTDCGRECGIIITSLLSLS